MSDPSIDFVAGSRQILRRPADVRYYSIKDRTMADAAEYRVLLWDGKSKGAVNNVVDMSRDHQPVEAVGTCVLFQPS